MTKTEQENWAQVRSKGQARFLLCEGVLKQGLPFGMWMILCRVLLNFAQSNPQPSIGHEVFTFVFFCFSFGGGMAAYQWRKAEAEFTDSAEKTLS